MKSKKAMVSTLFLVAETILYALILTTNNKWYMFSSIALCLTHSFACINKEEKFITIALCFTLVADFFLVLCPPNFRVWGMVFFLGAQTAYAWRLQRRRPHRGFLVFRISLIMLAEIVTFAVLGSNVDLLAIISLCYYANLLTSIVEGFSQFAENKLFPIGLVLFLLCDTVIGLQIATGSYLPIPTDSLLTDILYPGFNLAWLFYLPSQVLLSLSTDYHSVKENS